VDAEENQKQVSLRAHSPWKSLMRFPHFHRRDDEAGEKWKSRSRIPTFPPARVPLRKTKTKGGLAAGRIASMLILYEK
jgi:hypothetical protein